MNLANGGCKEDLADALTLGGIADHNVKCRWKERVNHMKLKNEIVSSNVKYQDVPQFEDHSYLAYINAQAVDLGLEPRFDFVHPIEEDNGEVFLSTYYEQQEERNKDFGQDPVTYLCLCPSCSSNLRDLTIGQCETTDGNKNNKVNEEVVNQDQDSPTKTNKNTNFVVSTTPNQNSQVAQLLPMVSTPTPKLPITFSAGSASISAASAPKRADVTRPTNSPP